MLFFLNYRGELAALSAALIWAIASLIYVGLGKQMQPLLLNFAKNGVAIALILLTLLLQGDFEPQIGSLNLGERVSWRSITGVLIALCGIWLLLDFG
jgi:drug/metabolite transporter (DMT)-like permease